MTEPETERRDAPEENTPGSDGWCAWGDHPGVIHSNNGFPLCVTCFNNAEKTYLCRHCGFEGIDGQLLERSSGAPICHECHEKLLRGEQLPQATKMIGSRPPSDEAGDEAASKAGKCSET